MIRGSFVLPVLLAATLLAACGKSEGKPAGGAAGGKRQATPFPVETQAVATSDVEYVVSAVGTIEAFDRIQVTARVAGVVDKVSFREGTLVKAGQLLAEIEPTRYRLAAETARVSVKKAEAALAEARAGRTRREEAVAKSPGLIPGEEIETWKAREDAAAADQQANQVAVKKADLDLRDALVRAPVGGAIETRSVETGQYVQPGTVLATLVQRDPLLVRFHVTDTDAARLAVGMAVRLADGAATRSARITFIAATADAQSRMVPVLGELGADVGQLRPGAFVQVSVPVGQGKDAPTIPVTAVRPSERGFLAFVVEDNVAHERVLILGLRTASQGVEVKSGVKKGEMLVVRGAEALRDGAAVRVVAPGSPAGPPPPAPDGKPEDKPKAGKLGAQEAQDGKAAKPPEGETTKPTQEKSAP